MSPSPPYQGPERRNLSECPMTAEQAYKMENRIDQLWAVQIETQRLQQEFAKQQKKDSENIADIKKYIFAGRAVLWALASVGALAAWAFGIWHDIREFFRS